MLRVRVSHLAPANTKADVVAASPDSRLMSRRLRIVGPVLNVVMRVALKDYQKIITACFLRLAKRSTGHCSQRQDVNFLTWGIPWMK